MEPPRENNQYLTCKDFFDYIDKERSKDLETLARKYRAIGPLLTKMEGLVANTNSGKSEQLRAYYNHWEKKIYDALLQCTINNLKRCNMLIRGQSPKFEMQAWLAGPDVVLNPQGNEVYKQVLQCAREIVEGLVQVHSFYIYH